jgi:uncharacterized protein YggE
MKIRTAFMARKRTVVVLGVSAVMIAAIACSGGDDGESVGQTPSPTDGPPVVNNIVDVSPDLNTKGAPPADVVIGIPIGTPDVGGAVSIEPALGAPARVIDSLVTGVPAIAPLPVIESRSVGVSSSGFVETSFGFAPSPAPSGSSQQHGIWINGIGSIDVEPDVAILSVGVEARESTVSEAREAAAVALQAVVDAVIAEGVAVDDIKTTSFRISPQVIYREVRDVNGSYSQPQIIGYIVSNQLSVTIRDLDRVGDVVDSAAENAGDLVRINNIQFAVDDTSQYAVQLRQLAAVDARAKAEIYADAMGVQLGSLIFLTETGSSAPRVAFDGDFAVTEAAFAKSAPTPFFGGDSALTSRIQAVFEIIG